MKHVTFPSVLWYKLWARRVLYCDSDVVFSRNGSLRIPRDPVCRTDPPQKGCTMETHQIVNLNSFKSDVLLNNVGEYGWCIGLEEGNVSVTWESWRNGQSSCNFPTQRKYSFLPNHFGIHVNQNQSP